MAEEENQATESSITPNPVTGRLGRKKKKKFPQMKKKPRHMPEFKPAGKLDQRMKNLIRKRARDYNSDDDEENENRDEKKVRDFAEEGEEEPEEENGEEEEDDKVFSGDDEDGDVQRGITKFVDGCRAYRLAFKSIVKKTVNGVDLLGPVMSSQKKLMAEKLAEELAEQHVKRQNKKMKHLIAEKGHVKPETFLNSHEKFLISIATKGVVKLFNAVNKAQLSQRGLNPSRAKDEKALRKRRKEAFYSELKKKNSSAATASTSQVDGEGPAWAPLRDNYLLTSSKLKDWDKMPERASTDDIERVLDGSSSDDE